jgi:hypothetical protein
MNDDVNWSPERTGNLTTAAIAMHEIFTSLLSAGFTEQQALYLTAQLTTGGQRKEKP